MSQERLSRRIFLKSSLLFAGNAAWSVLPDWLVPDRSNPYIGMGRVTTTAINLYEQPKFGSIKVGKCNRDDLLGLVDEFISPDGPAYNPVWYETKYGYAHSGYIQRVDNHRINQPLETIPQQGILGEVTVPFTTTFTFTRLYGWVLLYRLYFESIHWITGITEGPDYQQWYRITDQRINLDYHVLASHLRPIPFDEYQAISPHIPPAEKRIEVSIESQTLSAFEGEELVKQFIIASGIHSKNQNSDVIPTDTPFGTFRIQTKMPSRHMGNGLLTSDINDYELPGVPWTMVFHETGVAIHGTYWHNNFGTRMSHGCVNMRCHDAKWIFRWTNPTFTPDDYYVREAGTVITIK